MVVRVPPPRQHSSPLSLRPTGTVAETGTIAGIASALAMALIGAVSSYISYQQKKFCFSIQRKCPPPRPECLKGTEQAPTYLAPEPRCHFPAWRQEGVPGIQRPGAGRAKPQPWVIEPPQPRQALHRQEPTSSDGPRTHCHPGASTQPLTRTHSHSQRPNPQHQTG